MNCERYPPEMALDLADLAVLPWAPLAKYRAHYAWPGQIQEPAFFYACKMPVP